MSTDITTTEQGMTLVDGDYITIKRAGGKRAIKYVVTGQPYMVSKWLLIPVAPYRYGERGSETVGKPSVAIVGQDEMARA